MTLSAVALHPSTFRNSGNRNFGTSAGLAFSFVAVVLVVRVMGAENGSPLQLRLVARPKCPDET